MSEPKRRDAIAGEIVHVYDDIEEADNSLPRWWVAVFVGTLIFGAIYWLAYEEFRIEPTAHEALIAAQEAARKRAGGVSDEDLLASSRDSGVVAAGQATFATTCAACHGAQAQGSIGPNLTDANWIHGGAPGRILSVVRDGVPEKGMPSWGPALGEAKIREVTAFLLTIRNTNVAGKQPEGEPWAGL